MSIPNTIPKVSLILDYTMYFGEQPENRLSLIGNICKTSILYELTALNYRLKPKDKIQIDFSFESQLRELENFARTPELFDLYAKVAEKFSDKRIKKYPLFFTKQACQFAIEEIINSTEIKEIKDYDSNQIEFWNSIMKYLLAVNYTITQIKKEDDSISNFETINAKLIYLNELSIETNPIFIPYRGYLLIQYFLRHPSYSDDLLDYFQETYGIKPDHFIFLIMSLSLGNNNENPDHNFYYQVPQINNVLFECLSKQFSNKAISKLLSIRKFPFIKVGENKYLVSDNTFLIEKTYSQFLNDFWFDKIKRKYDTKKVQEEQFKLFRSAFGYFFEEYLTAILKRCFENYKYSKLLVFNDLKFGKNEIELADVYFRYGNKVIIGQAKSGNIYDEEKFSGDLELLYKNDREKFFENFGVNQIVTSIKNVNEHMIHLDSKFPKGHLYYLYPCIIVNDKALQTPFMADTFNKRLNELVKSIEIKKIHIYPLTLIHISDLERMEDYLYENPKRIWELLKDNFKDKRFIPPFYSSINKNIKERSHPKRVTKLLKELIIKYNS